MCDPSHAPKEGAVLGGSIVGRVIHSKETHSYVVEIQEIMGQDGIYCASAF